MKSIRVSVSAAVVAASVILIPPTQAAMLTALSSFGGGDGWLAPGDRTYLANDNNQRGLAYNPTTGHVLLVNRTGGLSVNVMDGATGADLGALTGVGTLTGGTFAGSMIGVAGDGAVYVANLTVNSTTSPFKIYRWANETSASPTVAFSGNPLAGSRIGDTLDALGSGTDTLLVAGYGSTPVVAGNNSFAMFSTADGSNYASTHISVGTTPPNAGDFRLGITFLDSDTVIGKQSSISLGGRVVDPQEQGARLFGRKLGLQPDGNGHDKRAGAGRGAIVPEEQEQTQKRQGRYDGADDPPRSALVR